MAAIVVEVDAHGRPVACRRGRAGPERQHLRHLAARLEAARHPGVVELLSLDEEGDETVLRLGLVAGQSLADRAEQLPVQETARLAAALAATLADLHRRGVVHGRLTADHVLLAPDRPVLCGWSGGEAVEAHHDVASLGHLVLAQLPDEPAGDDVTTAALRELAERTTAATADGPGASALLPALDRLVSPPSRPSPRTTRRHPDRRRWMARAVVGLVPAALVVAGVVALVSDSDDGGTAPIPPLTTGRVPPTTADPATTRASTIPPTSTPEPTPSTAAAPPPTRLWPPPACPAHGLVGPDLDADACPDPIAQDGRQVRVGDARYDVGADGDQVVVGDWDCDGLATAAVLRPATGEVFVFDGWPAGPEPTSITATTAVERATGLRADPTPERCHRLVIVRTDGAEETVPEPDSTEPG